MDIGGIIRYYFHGHECLYCHAVDAGYLTFWGDGQDWIGLKAVDARYVTFFGGEDGQGLDWIKKTTKNVEWCIGCLEVMVVMMLCV